MFNGLFAQTVVWKPTGRVGRYHPSYEGPVSRWGRETFVESPLLNPPGLLSLTGPGSLSFAGAPVLSVQ